MEYSLKERLIGSWALLSFEAESSEGVLSYPLGKDAEGSILYAPDGYVAVNIMKKDRSGFVDKALYENNPLTYQDLPYLAYSGKYLLDANRPSVTHMVEVSFYPEWIGQQQFRMISWLGKDLQLASDGEIGPDKIAFRLLWRRKSAISP
jgi:hypothetical protein